MDKQYPITDQLSVITAQVRLLAGLMLAGSSLQEVESDAFALMLQDLAVRLEHVTEASQRCCGCPEHMHREVGS